VFFRIDQHESSLGTFGKARKEIGDEVALRVDDDKATPRGDVAERELEEQR
jgi:hypothetical protein